MQSGTLYPISAISNKRLGRLGRTIVKPNINKILLGFVPQTNYVHLLRLKYRYQAFSDNVLLVLFSKKENHIDFDQLT